MITRFSVKNYKALRDVSLDLTPMHVLIGPNDSGKTSILEAMAALCRSVDRPIAEAFGGKWEGLELVWRNEGTLVELNAEGNDNGSLIDYGLKVRFSAHSNDFMETIEEINIGELTSTSRSPHLTSIAHTHLEKANGSESKLEAQVHALLSTVQSYQWVPSFLGLPNALDFSRQFEMDHTGFGLTLCLDNILGHDRNQFIKLEQRFKSLFPNIETIHLSPESAFIAPNNSHLKIPELKRQAGKGIHFRLKDSDTLFRASQASDGMLIILAYLAILHLPQPPRVLLIEEPENGIHPARLAEVLSILRELISEQDHTQVILTTHSSYVVDHFEPKEVTLCYKGDDGAVRTRRLDESKMVSEQVDFFTLGEIWTAEGDQSLLEPIDALEAKE
jgi:predicted ATPase